MPCTPRPLTPPTLAAAPTSACGSLAPAPAATSPARRIVRWLTPLVVVLGGCSKAVEVLGLDVQVTTFPDTSDATAVGETEETSGGETDVTPAEVIAPPVQVTGTLGLALNVLDPLTTFDATVFVTDAYGAPIAGAEVVVAGTAFAAQGTRVTVTHITVGGSPNATARAPGFMPNGVVLDVSRGRAGVKVILQPLEASVTFPASAGGVLAMSAGSVSLQADGLVTASGAAYSGQVTVGGRSLDIERDFFDANGSLLPIPAGQVPEPYLAITNATGGIVPSIPLGIVHVELKGAAGEALQPATGKPATVSFGMSGRLADFFADQFTDGVTLPVASRDEATGIWSKGSDCVVAKNGDTWSCVGQVQHFSTAAVVAPGDIGCVKASEVHVEHSAQRALAWRQHTVEGTIANSDYVPATHYYDNDDKVGVCALVPMKTGEWRLKGTFQDDVLGTPTRTEADVSKPTTQMSVSLGEPFAANLEGLTLELLKTPAGCIQACGGSPGVVVTYTLSYDPNPVTPPDPPTPPGALPPGVEPPKPDIPPAPTDDDHDGSPADADCDDDDETRFPENDEVCDGKDQNCNDIADDDFPDTDEDGHADCVETDDDDDGDPDVTDCAPTDSTRFHGAKEFCDGTDQNCDNDVAGESIDTDSDGLFDTCDAHPTLACPCYDLAAAKAIGDLPNADCRFQSTTTLPPQTGIASYSGVHIDYGGGVFELAGTGLGQNAGEYGCMIGCVDNFATAGGTCAAVSRPAMAGSQELSSDDYEACQDLVRKVCP